MSKHVASLASHRFRLPILQGDLGKVLMIRRRGRLAEIESAKKGAFFEEMLTYPHRQEDTVTILGVISFTWRRQSQFEDNHKHNYNDTDEAHSTHIFGG